MPEPKSEDRKQRSFRQAKGSVEEKIDLSVYTNE